MIDLISTNLTDDEKLIVEEFKAFTNGVISNEQIDKANTLRDSIGNKMVTCTNHDWSMLVVMCATHAYQAFCDLGLGKIKHYAVIQDPAAREFAYSIKAFMDSLDNGEHKWMVNSGFVVDGYTAGGFVSSVMTVNDPRNSKAFDILYNYQKPRMEEFIKNNFQIPFGMSLEARIPITKEGVRIAMSRVSAFMFNNPSFTIS